ncbi:MAG: aldehyde ferredoxin oxidoreductase N-terminal domain-containing protein, partial [Bacteroidales bacterium]
MGRDGWFGYHGTWAWVDLTSHVVRIEPADAEVCRQYIGGRGVQAHLVAQKVASLAPLGNPLSPDNRLVIGSGPLNDAAVATAGRGSCTFISPVTWSAQPAPWIPGHTPIHGLLTHSSAGGLFPNMLKRSGIDHLVIDGRADEPVRLVVTGEGVVIVDAEPELFEEVGGLRSLRPASAIAEYLAARHPGSATVSTGPAGWNLVPYACLTNDRHRNFGRGGAGAVFGSK